MSTSTAAQVDKSFRDGDVIWRLWDADAEVEFVVTLAAHDAVKLSAEEAAELFKEKIRLLDIETLIEEAGEI